MIFLIWTNVSRHLTDTDLNAVVVLVLAAELLFTHFSEFGGPNMDIFGGKSEDFGSPLHQIYSLFGGNSEDFGCPLDGHGT